MRADIQDIAEQAAVILARAALGLFLSGVLGLGLYIVLVVPVVHSIWRADQEYRQSGEERGPPRRRNVRPALRRYHPPPRGRRGRYARTHETQSRLGQYHLTNAQSRNHNDSVHHSGQNVTQYDARRGRARHSRQGDVVAFLQGKRLSPREAHVSSASRIITSGRLASNTMIATNAIRMNGSASHTSTARIISSTAPAAPMNTSDTTTPPTPASQLCSSPHSAFQSS